MGGLSKVLKVITKRPKKSVQKEARQGRKRAERGKQKTEQVAKRVLTYKQKRPFHSLNWQPETAESKLIGIPKEIERARHKSANWIVDRYTGKEIVALLRKATDPRFKARLRKALKKREVQGTKKIAESWKRHKKEGSRTSTPPKVGSRGAKLKAKYGESGFDYKRGGTVKRKSGGKMNTDGNAYVASLYKGGKVGG